MNAEDSIGSFMVGKDDEEEEGFYDGEGNLRVEEETINEEQQNQ